MIRNKLLFALVFLLLLSFLADGKKKKEENNENAAALKKCSKEEKKLVKCVDKGIYDVDLENMGTVAQDIIKSFRASKDYKKLAKEALELAKEDVINEYLESEEFLEFSAAQNVEFIASEEGQLLVEAATMELYKRDAPIIIASHEFELNKLEQNVMMFVNDLQLYLSDGAYGVDYYWFQQMAGHRYSNEVFILPLVDAIARYRLDGHGIAVDIHGRNSYVMDRYVTDSYVMDSPAFNGPVMNSPMYNGNYASHVLYNAPPITDYPMNHAEYPIPRAMVPYAGVARMNFPVGLRVWDQTTGRYRSTSPEVPPTYQQQYFKMPVWEGIQQRAHNDDKTTKTFPVERIEISKNILDIMNPMGFLIPNPQTEPVLMDVIEDPWAGFVNSKDDETKEMKDEKSDGSDDDVTSLTDDEETDDGATDGEAREELVIVERMKFFMKF